MAHGDLDADPDDGGTYPDLVAVGQVMLEKPCPTSLLGDPARLALTDLRLVQIGAVAASEIADPDVRRLDVDQTVMPRRSAELCVVGRREPEEGSLALIMTNAPALWTPPRSGARRTRDHEFRIQDGRTLDGALL